MNVHTARPACYLASGEPEPRAPGFKEDGHWCYQTLQGLRLTPGCDGCRRFKEQVMGAG